MARVTFWVPEAGNMKVAVRAGVVRCGEAVALLRAGCAHGSCGGRGVYNVTILQSGSGASVASGSAVSDVVAARARRRDVRGRGASIRNALRYCIDRGQRVRGVAFSGTRGGEGVRSGAGGGGAVWGSGGMIARRMRARERC